MEYAFLSERVPTTPTLRSSRQPGADVCAGRAGAQDQDARDWSRAATAAPSVGCVPPVAGAANTAPPAAPSARAALPAQAPAPSETAAGAKPVQPSCAFRAPLLPEAVLCLPNTHALLRQIAEDPRMEWDLPPPRFLAGAVLAHAVAAIAKRLAPCPDAFKIGITSHPIHRWHNDRYGYRWSPDRFRRMILLLATHSGPAAAFLEAALIGRFQNTRGCRNIASGGEGLKPTVGPFFTYLVISIRA